MRRRRSGLAGVTKLRKTLRRLDPEIVKDLKTVVREGGEAIKQDQIAGAPVREGDLVREIDYKLGRDGMTVVVGPGAKRVNIASTLPFGEARMNLSPAKGHALLQFFKAYWYEFGTKGSPKRNIPPQAAKPFLIPAYDINKEWMLRRARKAIAEALAKASQ